MSTQRAQSGQRAKSTLSTQSGQRAEGAGLLRYLLPLLICGAFLALQIPHLNYGTTINNLPHIASAKVPAGAINASRLDRRNLIAERSGIAESPGKWAMRFKIYSVMPDDIVSIMALARIKPAALRLDPGFYLYGGGFIYPLGAWYLGAKTLGAVEPGNVAQLLAAPDRMDAVFTTGRFFVLLAFVGSALLLWAALARLTKPGIAALCLGLYLTVPASVLFSLHIKPHWYAMLWANLAIFGTIAIFTKRRAGIWTLVLIGAGTGLAVGSASSFAPLSIAIWLALVGAVANGFAPRRSLVVVPAVAALVFLATNPYVILNWSSFQAERAAIAKDWFVLDPALSDLPGFIANSFFPGVGLALGLLVLGVVVLRLVRPGGPGERPLAIGLLTVICVVALLTGAMQSWNINLRYAPYFLSGALILLALSDIRWKGPILGTALALTIAQAAPLWLAFGDENSPKHSTRLRAATWIARNIPANAAISLGTRTPGPYDVPPIELNRYRITHKAPEFLIITHPAHPLAEPSDGKLIKRFRARLSLDRLPLVYDFINPTISVYRMRPVSRQAQ